jgi:hypothetical protein
VPQGDIRTRLLIAVHAGAAGHRSLAICYGHLQGRVWWPSLRQDLSALIDSCIHCIQNKKPFVKRPFGQQVAPSHRNEIVSFDFVHLGTSRHGNVKLLVICDRFTNFTQLHPVRSENAEQTATALLLWFGSFGVPKAFLSDLSPAFQNSVIAELALQGHIDHKFVTARAHWSGGKQERRNLDLGNATRKWLSEFRLPIGDWELLVPLLLGLLNHTPTAGNNGKSPSSCFLGINSPTPLDWFLDNTQTWRRLPMTPQRKAKIADELTSFNKSTEVWLHEFQEQAVYLSRVAQAKKAGVKPANFVVGDYVMAMNEYATAKHANRWHGPCVVLNIYDDGQVYGVRFLSHRTKHAVEQRIHASHLRLFDHGTYVVTPELLQQSEYFAHRKWDITRLLDIRVVRSQWQLKVLWESGLESWEPMDVLDEDVPGLVHDFLTKDHPVFAKARVDACLAARRGAHGGTVKPARRSAPKEQDRPVKRGSSATTSRTRHAPT